MGTQRQKVRLDKLLSPKTSIQYRDSSGKSFNDMVRDIKNGKSLEPIEVTPVRDMYYIWNGVRRAVASLKAGKTDIDAIILYSAGKPSGTAVPLKKVEIP